MQGADGSAAMQGGWMKYAVLAVMLLSMTAMSTTLIGLTAFAGGACATEPPGLNAFHARLHWSQPAKVESPDHVWELAVHPIYHDGGNHSPVVVRKHGGKRANVILTLERSADIYWSGRSRLLVIDHPITVPRRILLFRLESTGAATRLRRTSDLDADIRDRALRALGRAENVAFYIPTFGSWTGSRLVLRVGGTFVYNNVDSRMTPYCYRFTVDSRTGKVEGMAKESALEHSTKCQIFP
jgi:hypothetical protein